jgi:peptidoglycan/LPS O-acetylase OafA/YrhL
MKPAEAEPVERLDPDAPYREIRPLTGVRIVAATWVVLFHIRGNLYSEFPGSEAWLGPLLTHGELGVDLFFALSGYVLVYNYAGRMGAMVTRRGAAVFWWARLARVWPVFLLTLLVAMVWHGGLRGLSLGDPVPPNEFSIPLFFRQLTLVALWTEPEFDRLMWNGPAWSVSAEAFAYAWFPLAVLFFWRLGRGLSRQCLALWSVVAVLPISVFVGAYDTLYTPWSWLLRIVCGFTAGALMCEAQRGLEPTERQRRWASHAALALVVVFVIGLYGAVWTGFGRFVPVMAPFFVILIGLLAIGDRHIARLLATRVFVTGGAASYSVYMVHMRIIEPFWWAQGHGPWVAPGTVGSKIGFILLPFVVSGAGYLLWRFFEEPARRAMRRMSLGARGGPVAEVVPGWPGG